MNASTTTRTVRSLALLSGAVALLIANRRWNERFAKVETSIVPVDDGHGRIHRGRRILVQSILNAPPELVWALAQRPAMLAEVSYPLLGFFTRDGRPLPSVWKEGATTELNLYGLGFLPLGRHVIAIDRIDPKTGEIQTRESSQLAPVWNHLIRIEPFGDGQTLYTDQVDISAGLLNPLVMQFALAFYRFRQSQWQDRADSL